jgi:molecular chaperone GrpE
MPDTTFDDPGGDDDINRIVEDEANEVIEEAEAEVSASEPVVDEAVKYKEMAQRIQAEFENYRKQSAKRLLDDTARANEQLVSKLLPVLDTIDLALAHDPNGSLEQVRGTLMAVLTKEGLERIDAVDQTFDPEVHEAVAHEPGDGDPHVSEDLRAGYRWKGRVIRPSMVKVSGT